VQARLDLWLKSHIERLLEPLYRLAAAEDVTGIARGVAFQLTEALGVLDRQRVADDVKGLDQPARATLRKYGVRFGAYHLYLPALLKPAPRVLATQLWALKHGGPETKGLDAILQLAGSGRTSIAADPEIAKSLYRIAGYRQCGERAVRVDILERLADLIRPALAWRAGAAGTRPPGAIDGFGFTVTPGMMSLAGCSGENFASVLRSLGYRMEKRPKPIEPPPAPVQSEAPAQAQSQDVSLAETAPADEAAAPADAQQSKLDAVDEMGEATAATPADDAAVPTAPVVAEPIELAGEPMPAEPEAVLSVPEAPALAVSEPSQPLADSEAAALPQPPESASKTEVSATELIEVWRPGRRDEHPRPPRHERRPHARRPRRDSEAPRRDTEATPVASVADGATSAAAQAAPAALDGAEPAPAADTHRDARRRHRDAPERVEAQEHRPRFDRTPRRPRSERFDATQRGERPQREGRHERSSRGDRPERDPELRAKYIKGRGDGRDRRDRQPDPNSPFAKLAALKEQLEANTKEPR
jgi:ATP-dependent RNA helicase SUPV3L1/SUV3